MTFLGSLLLMAAGKQLWMQNIKLRARENAHFVDGATFKPESNSAAEIRGECGTQEYSKKFRPGCHCMLRVYPPTWCVLELWILSSTAAKRIQWCKGMSFPSQQKSVNARRNSPECAVNVRKSVPFCPWYQETCPKTTSLSSEVLINDLNIQRRLDASTPPQGSNTQRETEQTFVLLSCCGKKSPLESV